MAGNENSQRTLQSFGVTVESGRILSPLPSNVALGLYNPDLLPDVGYYNEGVVEIYKNLGNGVFDFVGEHHMTGTVAAMVWCNPETFRKHIPNQFRWGELRISFDDGRREVLSYGHLNTEPGDPSLFPQPHIAPPLDFREVWRSNGQTQPATYMAVDDIDNDGRMEIAYCFFPPVGSPDTNRFVVYECVGNDSFVVEWDTILVGGFGPLAATDLDGNGQKEWVIVTNGAAFLECEGNGQYRYYGSNIQFIQGYITKGLQSDIDGDGRREICIQQANPSPPPGGDGTYIFVGEFIYKGPGSGGLIMGFDVSLARYVGYTFEMAVGQVDGTGRDEIIPAGGSFGVGEPVPIAYLWYNGSSWVVRQIHTGLQSGTTAPLFVNLDSDTTKELFIGGVGPIGHGSCYALDYVSDTTWSVLWADSSLTSTPLSVNAGILGGEFLIAGANTWYSSQLDTIYSQLTVYQPSGQVVGFYQHAGSMQNFHILDIDDDGIANLISPILVAGIGDHLSVFEYYGVTHSGEDTGIERSGFRLLPNYPNPFNPRTTISYEVAARGHVTLRVYNLLGEEVLDLVNGIVEPGSHTAQVDASDLASGVYFYRLGTERGAITRKMVLIR